MLDAGRNHHRFYFQCCLFSDLTYLEVFFFFSAIVLVLRPLMVLFHISLLMFCECYLFSNNSYNMNSIYLVIFMAIPIAYGSS